MTGDRPSIDLVLATLGRTTEVAGFLNSLVEQTYRGFRVILIDQNSDERLEQMVIDFAEAIAITRVRSEPGLSHARNIALPKLEGDVIAFPDDDCIYLPDLLMRVGDLLVRHPEWDGIAGRTVDERGESSFIPWPTKPALVTRMNVWRRAVSTTIFFRRAVVEQVGSFDETLGAGSATQWGSGEETDYVLRALAAGFKIRYEPEVSIVHESPQPHLSPGSAHKAYLTGMGNSRVLRKHSYPAWFAALRVLQLVAGSAYLLMRGRAPLARFYAAMARGRIRGWFEA